MNVYERINSVLKATLCSLGGGKIAIYPFGKMGMQVKQILNQQYGILEAIIVDNYLADINPQIQKIDEVMNPEEYIWVITTADKAVKKSIIESLPISIPENQIIELFMESAPYSNDFKVLSHIGRDGINSVPAWEVLECVRKKKRDRQTISVAEIGIDIGATAVEICKLLDKKDKYYAYDFEYKINALFEDFSKIPEIVCELNAEGNSERTYDSYNWNLSEMVLDMKENQIDGVFDVIYLDGAHSFCVDGLCCCLIKKLIKKDGYIIFDDIDWSFKKDCPNSPQYGKFTEEQVADCQIKRVINIFMQEDDNFRELYLLKTLVPKRVVYQRIH